MSVIVYSVGVMYCSVCAPKDMPREEVEKSVNAAFPTGLDHGWHISADKTFANTDRPNPCECDQNADRLHWLLSC